MDSLALSGRHQGRHYMRFARVEGLYFDRDKRRYFVERRVLRDVHEIMGGALKRRRDVIG